MAKKKKPAAAWYRKRRFQVVAIIAPLALLFIGYNLVLDWQDKKRFDQSRQSVDSLSEKIVAESSRKPDQVITVAECGRNKLKYGEGDLACSYSRLLNYSNLEIVDANSVIQEQISYAKNQDGLEERYGNLPVQEIRMSDQGENTTSYVFKHLGSGHDCSISFSYSDQYSSLEAKIYCSSKSRNSYYSEE